MVFVVIKTSFSPTEDGFSEHRSVHTITWSKDQADQIVETANAARGDSVWAPEFEVEEHALDKPVEINM